MFTPSKCKTERLKRPVLFPYLYVVASKRMKQNRRQKDSIECAQDHALLIGLNSCPLWQQKHHVRKEVRAWLQSKAYIFKMNQSDWIKSASLSPISSGRAYLHAQYRLAKPINCLWVWPATVNNHARTRFATWVQLVKAGSTTTWRWRVWMGCSTAKYCTIDSSPGKNSNLIMVRYSGTILLPAHHHSHCPHFMSVCVHVCRCSLP